MPAYPCTEEEVLLRLKQRTRTLLAIGCDSTWLWRNSEAPSSPACPGRAQSRRCAPLQDIIPADRMAAVAHLPGIEKLLRCMLVRDPARRATLGDISRRCASYASSGVSARWHP